MRVEVRLFATLAHYLPAGGEGDRAALDVPPQTTVGQVVDRLGIPEGLECLRVVNGLDADLGQVLAEGDVLAMFPPLAGGA